MELIESQVVQHVSYQEACDTFTGWLQDSKDKLIECSDVAGDAQTVESKLSQIQVQIQIQGTGTNTGTDTGTGTDSGTGTCTDTETDLTDAAQIKVSSSDYEYVFDF